MKLVYRIAVTVTLTVLAVGTAMIAFELRKLNHNIDSVLTELPMSLRGN